MRYALSLSCALLLGPLQAHAAELRQPLPEVYAVVDVRVVTEPGRAIESATIVIRDGVIEAVGADVEPPADAAIVRFERGDDQPPISVYPGLIDPYLVVGGDDNEESGGDEESEPVPGRHPLIRPDHQLEAAAWPADTVDEHRRAGFTSALMVPGSGMLRGRSLLANLGGGGLSANLLDSDVAQHAHLHERHPDGAYPQSLMGSVALFRQTLMDAAWQARARAAWSENPAQPRPEWLPGIDALAPVLGGDQPLVFESRDVLDSLRILDLVGEGIDLVLVGHGEEYKRLGDFGRSVPHILPLDFPSAPDVEDENDRDVSLEQLRHWQQAPGNPSALIGAGVPVLFTAHGQSTPTDLFKNIARAVDNGLDSERALAALTTGPAQWLGIDDRAGRIAPGYMANLVLVEGELFIENPTISEVWIDGHRFELTKLEPPEVDPSGTWALTLGLSGMGDVDAELTLSGPPTSLDGSMAVMGNDLQVTEGRVSGKQVQLKFNLGGSGTISVNMEVDGDRARGNGTGPYGEFTVRGDRSGPPGGTAGDGETRT